jgi:hypothetical protein
MLIFESGVDNDGLVMSNGIEGAKTPSEKSGRREENSVRDARGSRLGRSGMARMWVKRSKKH